MSSASVTLGRAEQKAADAFVSMGTMAKTCEKARAEAKATLIAALGDYQEGILPDGRRVLKILAEFPEATISRKAYTSTTLNITPLPVADAWRQLVASSVPLETKREVIASLLPAEATMAERSKRPKKTTARVGR